MGILISLLPYEWARQSHFADKKDETLTPSGHGTQFPHYSQNMSLLSNVAKEVHLDRPVNTNMKLS